MAPTSIWQVRFNSLRPHRNADLAISHKVRVRQRRKVKADSRQPRVVAAGVEAVAGVAQLLPQQEELHQLQPQPNRLALNPQPLNLQPQPMRNSQGNAVANNKRRRKRK